MALLAIIPVTCKRYLLQVDFENGGELSGDQCWDYVELWDDGALLVKFCDRFITSSPTYVATSATLNIRFLTSPMINYKGFLLTVTLLGKHLK